MTTYSIELTDDLEKEIKEYARTNTNGDVVAFIKKLCYHAVMPQIIEGMENEQSMEQLKKTQEDG